MAKKKVTDAPVAMKRAEVEEVLATMSVVRQCGLLELSRSTFYYQPVGEDAYNLALMRLIDEQFTKHPFYGEPRMTASLRRMGFGVNPKQVRRLMRVMGLEAIYPRPRLSANGPDHLERGRRWPRLRRPWFDMDRIEIVVPMANGEAVFSGFTVKIASGLQNR